MPISFPETVPILRFFDEPATRGFYLDYLGFAVDFEHRFGDDFPLYLAVCRDGLILHLSQHHGDATPGAHVRIACPELEAFLAELARRPYAFVKPGLAGTATDWGTFETTLTDPAGNRLTFWRDAE
jgi:catechol 2,3-dioxygenase-like lactoylglutathione lyase family enzyme